MVISYFIIKNKINMHLKVVASKNFEYMSTTRIDNIYKVIYNLRSFL